MQIHHFTLKFGILRKHEVQQTADRYHHSNTAEGATFKTYIMLHLVCTVPLLTVNCWVMVGLGKL